MFKKSWIGVGVFLLGACATSPRTTPRENNSSVARQRVPVLVQSQSSDSQNRNANPEEKSESNAENAPKPIDVGIWIQGVAFDSFASLGFLQELEKAGLRPKKIIGAGFGCWIAWAWALENNGNRAEWQSFKWDHWDYVKNASLLGRLGFQNNKEKFIQEVNKHFPKDLVSRAKISVDCPLVKNRYPYDLSSGKSISLGSLMWEQFQIPSITKTQAAQNAPYLSGLIAGLPEGEELDRYSSGNVEAWVVLRSHGSEDMLDPQTREALVLSQRARLAQGYSGTSPRGRPWLVVETADGAGRPSGNLLDSQKRRNWILSGRATAKKMLQEPRLNNFIFASPTVR